MNIIFLIILLILHYPHTSNGSPIALDKLVVMPPESKGIVIRLQRVEKSGKRLTCVISQLPERGTLYQLSNVYSSHGYEPIQGTKITANHTTITGSNNRVYYKPANQRLCSEHADRFAYTVTAHAQHAQAKGEAQANTQQANANANEGTVTIVDSSGTIVCSDFLLGPDDWTIIGNKASVSAPIYEPYSRNKLCNHYIYATDNHNHISTTNPMRTPISQRDKALWYFNAPSKMLGNMGIAYGGYISFVISIFAGDMKQMNQGVNLVELEGKTGMTLGYPMPTEPIINNMASFKIELTETSIWQKVNQDPTTPHKGPSKCEFIQVLSQQSGLRILGDLTRWTETVALDNVYIIGNTNNNNNNSPIIPLCAMSKPDASICTCV